VPSSLLSPRATVVHFRTGFVPSPPAIFNLTIAHAPTCAPLNLSFLLPDAPAAAVRRTLLWRLNRPAVPRGTRVFLTPADGAEARAVQYSLWENGVCPSHSVGVACFPWVLRIPADTSPISSPSLINPPHYRPSAAPMLACNRAPPAPAALHAVLPQLAAGHQHPIAAPATCMHPWPVAATSIPVSLQPDPARVDRTLGRRAPGGGACSADPAACWVWTDFDDRVGILLNATGDVLLATRCKTEDMVGHAHSPSLNRSLGCDSWRIDD